MPRIKKEVVKNPVPLVPASKPESLQEWEGWVVKNAVEFTMVHKTGPGQIKTAHYSSLTAAILAKKEHDNLPLGISKKTVGQLRPGMVYAWTEGGRSVMIAPAQYEEMLKLRGEI